MIRRIMVAFVGMPGAGKTVASRVREGKGCIKVRFGDLTDEHLVRRGLTRTEKNEKAVREGLRRTYGRAAYAVLNIPRIRRALAMADVVVDGLYSWEEYRVLKRRFRDVLHVVAIYAPPRTRYRRLERRAERPLTAAEAAGRDSSEIENIGKAGPIAMADWTIVNDGKGMRALEEEVERLWGRIKRSSFRRSRTGTTFI